MASTFEKKIDETENGMKRMNRKEAQRHEEKTFVSLVDCVKNSGDGNYDFDHFGLL